MLVGLWMDTIVLIAVIYPVVGLLVLITLGLMNESFQSEMIVGFCTPPRECFSMLIIVLFVVFVWPFIVFKALEQFVP